MILYHQTDKAFDKFDLSKARLGVFGVGAYFYTKKPVGYDAQGLVCDVWLVNTLREDEKIISDQKWEEMVRVVEEFILRENGEEIDIPPLGCSDIRNFQLLCNIYAGNVEDPDWPKFLSEFRRVTECDGFVAHDFVMCFDTNKIVIVGKF